MPMAAPELASPIRHRMPRLARLPPRTNWQPSHGRPAVADYSQPSMARSSALAAAITKAAANSVSAIPQAASTVDLNATTTVNTKLLYHQSPRDELISRGLFICRHVYNLLRWNIQ